jgi:hypothetical protein
MTWKLILTHDYGTANDKRLWSCNGQSGWELSSPLIRVLREDKYNDRLEQLNSTTALIKYQDTNGEFAYREVGLAIAGSGNVFHQKQKNINAIAKTLACLGKIVTENFYIPSGQTINVSVKVLLPNDEWATKAEICTNLRSALEAGFWYNGQRIENIVVDGIVPAIEGFGLSLPMDIGESTPDPYKSVLMIGHGDFAWLRFGVDASLSKIKPGKGMTLFLSLLQERYPFPDELTVAKALYEKNWKEIALSAEDKTKLKDALQAAGEEYYYESAIADLDFPSVRSILVGGGAGKFLFPAIKKYAPKTAGLVLPTDIVEEMRSTFTDMPEDIAYLFADAWQNFKRQQWTAFRGVKTNGRGRSGKLSVSVEPAKVYAEEELEDWNPAEILQKNTMAQLELETEVADV